jgi:hypothetical protein
MQLPEHWVAHVWLQDSPRRYFSIYMENPDVCKLLILKSKEDSSKDNW